MLLERMYLFNLDLLNMFYMLNIVLVVGGYGEVEDSVFIFIKFKGCVG